MVLFRPVLLILLLALTAAAQQNSTENASVPAASCPVTRPPAIPFKPPAPYKESDNGNSFLFGTEKLWLPLRTSGVWHWGPHEPGHERDVQPLTEKVFWASVNFNWREENSPALRVTGKRLDGDAPPLLTLPPTNAFPGPAAAMLVGVYVPTPGCWEITGEYKGEKLSFFVWVAPPK